MGEQALLIMLPTDPKRARNRIGHASGRHGIRWRDPNCSSPRHRTIVAAMHRSGYISFGPGLAHLAWRSSINGTLSFRTIRCCGSAMRVVIRAARAEDDAALQRVDAATWSSAVSPVPPPQQGRSFFDSTAGDEVLAAELGSEIVGYVKLGGFYKIDASSHVVELKGLAVDPDHQRSGIGTALVQAAIGAARRRKARRIVLRVLASNPTARRLYERCGFKVEGILREQFLLNDRYVDDVFMALDLTALK
jgi:ribosomal protein S18 acetylase RimI-like enzyme